MKKLFYIVGLLLLTNSAFGQEKLETKGAKEYYSYDYYAAVSDLEKVPQKDAGVLRKIAEGYNMIGDYAKAETYYSQLAARADRIPNDHLSYARVLMKNQKYSEAETQLKLYSKLNPNNEDMARFELLSESLAEYSKKGAAIKVSDLEINSDQEDFAPVVLNGKMYFASSRTSKTVFNRKWVGNKLPFLDIYSADISGAQLTGLAAVDSKEINKKYNEGPITFSPNGEEAYLTLNNYNGLSADGVRHLSLFVVKKSGDSWSVPEALPFNSDDYSVGHATVAPDGKTIYFASDMPGGKGGVDIYRSVWTDAGWSTPENMTELNTIGDEMFPYIHASGLFFYSSNGLPGYGGLDLYVGK